MKIYVASSWRNPYQPGVVALLREYGHDVYDFRNPPGRTGFSWQQTQLGDWTGWTPEQHAEALEHPVAAAGFNSDMNALRECGACLLVLPCGRSAHLELGWACGAGKHTVVYTPRGVQCEPELMYRMVDQMLVSDAELRAWAHLGGRR